MSETQRHLYTATNSDLEAIETQEWIDSLEYVLRHSGSERVIQLLEQLKTHAQRAGVRFPFSANTPYINTIPVEKQPSYPGSREIERRIKSIIRWNAMAMVVNANMRFHGIGGHISTYASAATLYEVGFNHFFRTQDKIYFQGHGSPGIYARAFLEGRLSEEQLLNFRQELKGGVPSYPHPWLMPDFWQFPTVSMGLGPITAIYHARFIKYMENRGLKPKDDQKVWAFLGDGETDEPEALGALTLASRERLNNLIFVVNCNLQRLDGPVRGNGKIIQELEAIFRGAGWNVIKVIWGNDWDPLFAQDTEGALARQLESLVDGYYQKFIVEDARYVREHVSGGNPQLVEMLRKVSDEQIVRMRRGGHDPEKVYAAYKAAVSQEDRPTVILAKTIKGYGLGEAGEGRNVTHQQKELNEVELREFRTRFGIPISDEDVAKAPFYKPAEDSQEIQYLKEQRAKLGGYVPTRTISVPPLREVSETVFEEFKTGTNGREVSTTMVFVRLLAKLLRDKNIGKLIVPIVPDEARTFGMEALFRQVGIYSSLGQVYEPVDSDSLLYYKEATNGQILEEGITEAGSMSSFIAAGTAYANHGVNTIPFYIFYSMFGLQRIGDLAWLAGDSRCKGFLLGATSGRTTLNGEGLQHQDGHSHVLASTVPNLVAYDPAYAYELAVIIHEGIKRMYVNQEDIFYYITVMNENYAMPPMPEGSREGILKGMYRLKAAENQDAELKAQLFGSGTILNEVLKAQQILAEEYRVAADVWSVTSYKELRQDALAAERWNMLHPTAERKVPYVEELLRDTEGPFVAASDYMKLVPDMIARWLPRPLMSLGTDGFGRSDTRAALRDFFEVDHRYVVVAALTGLAREGKIGADVVEKAIHDLNINADKADPVLS